VFGAAKALGDIAQNAINPAAWEDNLKHLLPEQPKNGSLRGKHKSLPYDELPAFMSELRALTQQSAKMLEVCILTCVRTTEVIQMQWSQLDFKRGRWVNPGKIMKNELQADIPLTATVLAILREIREAGWDDKLVFQTLSTHESPSQLAGRLRSWHWQRHSIASLRRSDCNKTTVRAAEPVLLEKTQR